MVTFSSETSANRHNWGKFETLIALQNDLRWLSCILGFQIFPGRGPLPPGPPYMKRYTGKFGISFFYPTSAPHRPPPPSSAHADIKTLFARHLIMIKIYDFVIRGFICSLWTELPLPPPFSPILLLLGYGYCYVKVSFQHFCWKR